MQMQIISAGGIFNRTIVSQASGKNRIYQDWDTENEQLMRGE